MVSSNLAIDLGSGVSDAWSSIATFVPKLVAFLVIVVIGWILAKVIAKIVDKVLERVGFDRLVERGGLRETLARSQYDASDMLAKVVYYAILLITLQMGFGVFGPNPVSDLLNSIVAWLPKLFVAIVLIVIVAAIAKAVKDLVSNALSGASYGSTLGTVASVFVWGIGIVAALNQIGVATTVTTPVLVTVLATVGGIAVVGFGGGLIRPMQERWDRWLGNVERELPAIKGQAQAYRQDRADGQAPAAGQEYVAARGYTDQGYSAQPGAAAPQPGVGQEPGTYSIQHGLGPAEGGYPPGHGQHARQAEPGDYR